MFLCSALVVYGFENIGMKKNVLFILTIVFLCSCRQSDLAATGDAIIIDSAESVCEDKTPMSGIFEVSNVISLETSDSCLLGEVEKIIKRDGIIYVKSRNRPLTLFDEKGKFMHTVGKIGVGPEDYSMLVDFDIKDGKVYVQTTNKIQIYDQDGKWVEAILMDLNASGMRLVADKILLFVLGDEHVIHLLDETGREVKSLLERNQALRLCRSISFIKYGGCFLFPMGRSNDLLAYTLENGTFKRMSYLSSEQLSNEQEASLIENNPRYRQELENRGCFDGLLTDNTHVMVPFIKKGDVTLWVKNIETSQTRAYKLSALENDLTFSSVYSFFLDNMESDCAFLTYVMPYRLKEYLDEAKGKGESPCIGKLCEAVEKSKDEGNPILIEYKIKD